MGKVLKIAIILCAMLVFSNGLIWSNRAQCGRRTYDPSFSLCCNGHVTRKGSTSSGCCGTRAYDAHFKLCCVDQAFLKIGIHPACCGRQLYDAALYVCFNGQVIRK